MQISAVSILRSYIGIWSRSSWGKKKATSQGLNLKKENLTVILSQTSYVYEKLEMQNRQNDPAVCL